MFRVIDPTVQFQLSEIVLPRDQIIRLVRFLVSVRHLNALTQSILALRKEKRVPSETEAMLILLLHLASSAKEAADRFRDCDANGLFAHVEGEGEALQQIRGDLATARTATNKRDGASLYARVLQPVRNSVGFHVDQSATAEALEFLHDEVFQTAEVDPDSTVTSIPLVTSVILASLPEIRQYPEKIASLLDEILVVQAALRDLAHDFYLLIVSLSTLPRRQSAEARNA